MPETKVSKPCPKSGVPKMFPEEADGTCDTATGPSTRRADNVTESHTLIYFNIMLTEILARRLSILQSVPLQVG